MAVEQDIAKAATPARDGARQMALQAAIEKGGSSCASLLRRWAKERRPYRGQVFEVEEVEEAVAAAEATAAQSQSSSAAESSGKATATPNAFGQTVLIQAKGWPTPELLEGAVSTAGALGPLGKELTKDSARLALLRGLYEPGNADSKSPCWGKAKHPDLQVVAGSSSTRISAHKAMLSAVSKMLHCKFCGSFGDAGETEIDASDFKEVAVRAAVEFIYTGKARLAVADVGSLCCLADFWECPLLADAVERCWKSLPIVYALEVLASLDQDAHVPAAMLGALQRSLEANFSGIADLLNRHQAGLGVLPSSEQVANCWRFVQELLVLLERLEPDAMERLRKWLSDEGELQSATESFMMAVVKAAAQRGNDELKRISKRRFKAWLPEAMLSRIIAQLIIGKREGDSTDIRFCDAAGQPQRWLQWTHWGGPTLEAVFEAYLQLLGFARQAEAASDAAAAAGLTPAAEAGAVDKFPLPLHSGFAVALVDEAFRDHRTNSVWEMIERRSHEETLPAVEEAMQVLARHTLQSRKLPQGVPLKVVLRVMNEAVSRSPASAVQINGPGSLAGVYEQKGSDTFVRAAAPLVLRRVVRTTGREAINIVWKGIPSEDFRKSLADWKVQQPEDDEHLDVPLAVALSASQDPCDLGGNWWLRASSGKFQQDASFQIRLHSIREAEAMACRTALAAWASTGGSLLGLEEAARKESPKEVALPMLCQAAVRDMAPPVLSATDAPQGESTKAVEKQSEADVNAKAADEKIQTEEDDIGWQEAAKTFDAVAEELCRVLKEAQKASADERRRLLQKKRRIESAPDFVAAVRRLEMPLGST
mmetsp:Transcript_74080/g.130969  ORF Transcript_74080/g.130969 Transcript_74080/m.130969 type:complete len:822 (-) Transcript_74080:38-2503(-)